LTKLLLTFKPEIREDLESYLKKQENDFAFNEGDMSIKLLKKTIKKAIGMDFRIMLDHKCVGDGKIVLDFTVPVGVPAYETLMKNRRIRQVLMRFPKVSVWLKHGGLPVFLKKSVQDRFREDFVKVDYYDEPQGVAANA
jgi:hypothetical protein